MPGTRMDGKVVAESVKDSVRQAVSQLKNEGTVPCLATILVGDDAASATYVRNKHAACRMVGMDSRDHHLPADATQSDLDLLVSGLNHDKTIHGILVQLPLPDHLDPVKTVNQISPHKDVDGLTPYNAGLLSAGRPALIPCTPAGIMEMLNHYDIGVAGKHAVIINRSSLVGIPLHRLLLLGDCTVSTCHSKTANLNVMCRTADIIITAVGNRDRFTLTSDMVKEGAVVIDVAITRHGGKLTGDADYHSIIERASHITPVPGGVGPMTVAMLLRNTATAASMVGLVG